MSETMIFLCGAAAAVGARLAGIAQPACHWSSLSAIALKTRLAMLKAVAPSRRRARMASLGLASLVGAGALAAYAAQPSAPERLAAEAAGVVGSGDQLALRVVEGGQERTLKPGETYADGWKLDALTPTSATLVKDGERLEVGLNPTGALAANATAAAPPSQVQVTRSDAERLEILISGGFWDGKTPRPGLTLEQTRRYYVLYTKGMELYFSYLSDFGARSKAAGLGPVTMRGGPDVFAAALGAEGPEFVALMNGEVVNKRSLAAALYDQNGPVEVRLPNPAIDAAGYRAALAKRDADYPGAAWTARPAAVGDTAQTYVMRPPDPERDRTAPTEIRPLDEVALVGPGGVPGARATMTGAQWFAQAAQLTPAP